MCYEAPQQGSLTTSEKVPPNRGPWLFGEDFGARAKAMSDSIRALKTSLGKRKAPFSPAAALRGNISTPLRAHRVAACMGFPPNSLQQDQFSNGLDHS